MIKKKSDTNQQESGLIASQKALRPQSDLLRQTDKSLQKKVKHLKDINARINNLIESTKIGAIIVDRSLKIQFMTPIISHFFDLKEQYLGRSLKNMTFHSDFQGLAHKTEWVIKTESIFEIEIKTHTGDWLLLRIIPYIEKNKLVYGAIITLMNINAIKLSQTEQSHLQENLSRIENRQSLLDYTSDGWWEWDLEQNTVYISPKLKEVLGYQDEDISNDIKSWQALIHPVDSQIALANIAACEHSKSSLPHIQEVRFMHKTNGFIWILCRSKALMDKNGKVIAIITTHTNITNLKIAEEKLYKMAHYDALTQLPNRSMFIQSMLEMIEDATKNNTKFVVLFMDLDNFNRVNDSLGHAVGDALLQTVATILKKLTRRHDVVARLGGDEFGIIIKNIHSMDEVEQITQRYIQAFTRSLDVDTHEIKTTPSIGLVLFPQYGQTPYELLQNADAAMYYAKQQGKNSYYFFDQKVKDQLIRRHAIDTQLQHALESREFSLVYQPKFDLKNDRPMGVEALIRWNNAKLGEVLPDEFIPIAEENRLIVPIGYWLLDKVITDYDKIEKIVKNRPFSMAVNMSMVHLSEPDFEFQIKQLLINHRFSSYDKLIFELTETALMERPEIAAGLLRNITKVGIEFSLDDFGTGFSSMQHIKTFPISSLKIDKSFIKDLRSDSDVATIVRAMIAFTKTLGMKVTAEGVESHDHLAFLKKEGCDEGQGYLLCKPLPLDELLCFLQTFFD